MANNAYYQWLLQVSGISEIPTGPSIARAGSSIRSSGLVDVTLEIPGPPRSGYEVEGWSGDNNNVSTRLGSKNAPTGSGGHNDRISTDLPSGTLWVRVRRFSPTRSDWGSFVRLTFQGQALVVPPTLSTGHITRRWWSGAGDLTFDSVTWEGTTSDADQGSLVFISSLEESADVPETRLQIRLNITSESVRNLYSRDFGSPRVLLQWIYSTDGINWIKLVRQYRGRVSSVVSDGGTLTVEVESKKGDVDRGLVIYWNDESHRRRYPSDTGFRHLRNLQEVGAQVTWPFKYD